MNPASQTLSVLRVLCLAVCTHTEVNHIDSKGTAGSRPRRLIRHGTHNHARANFVVLILYKTKNVHFAQAWLKKQPLILSKLLFVEILLYASPLTQQAPFANARITLCMAPHYCSQRDFQFSCTSLHRCRWDTSLLPSLIFHPPKQHHNLK